MSTVKQTYEELYTHLKCASVAQIGGFRPPENKLTSWFGGRGVGKKHETLPQYKGRNMFALLQVNVDELPVVPDELKGIALLIMFINREEYPFDKPHGDGWEIREYTTLDGLTLLPESNEKSLVKEFPIKWNEVKDDAPDWENAWELVNLDPINNTEGADEAFYCDLKRYPNTKFGGYPKCIQHAADLDGFVFQIGSEEKPNWMWADNGIAYFNKNKSGEWSFDCQFY
jgi:uncharacterized protein YwqG